MKWIIVVAVVGLILISGCGSSSTSTTDNNNQNNSQNNAVNNPSSTIKEANIKIGETTKVDDLSYKVTKVESFTKMGSSFMEEETTGKFIKVYLEILNESSESKNIFTPRFKIIDSKERKFDEFPASTLYIADGINFGEQLQPGLTLSGATVFEIPKDATGLTLEIGGDWLSITKINIELGTIEDIGEDTTLEDKLDEDLEDIYSQCNAPFSCSSNCPEYLDVGQKDCPAGQLCCMQN